MKIDKTFKIKEKYFNAILSFEKPFELRHQEIPENSIIKLECENGRYLIFKSGKSYLLTKQDYTKQNYPLCYTVFPKDNMYGYFHKEGCYYGENFYDVHGYNTNWYDTFCWEYITKAPTYLIEIAEILEVK